MTNIFILPITTLLCAKSRSNDYRRCVHRAHPP
jgi:hypothetical protein